MKKYVLILINLQYARIASRWSDLNLIMTMIEFVLKK